MKSAKGPKHLVVMASDYKHKKPKLHEYCILDPYRVRICTIAWSDKCRVPKGSTGLKRQALQIFQIYGWFPKTRVSFMGGPHDKDSRILGSVFRSLPANLGKLAYASMEPLGLVGTKGLGFRVDPLGLVGLKGLRFK